MTGNNPGPLIRGLHTPAAVVTYRAVVGLLAAATVALISTFGSRILSGIDALQEAMVQVQISVARNGGRIDSQDARIGRVEATVDGLNEKTGALDRRVTVIETRQGPR
jgi:hypothetical protein